MPFPVFPKLSVILEERKQFGGWCTVSGAQELVLAVLKDPFW